jgi:hypothetical protein
MQGRAARAALCGFPLFIIGYMGCSPEPSYPAPPPLPPASMSSTGQLAARTEVDRFATIVRELRGIVNLLGQTPPLDEGDGLRRAIGRLAAAIETTPGPAGPSQAEAAKLMKSRDFDVWIASIRKDGRAEKVREVLEIAAGALTLAAASYRDSREVMSAAGRFRAAVDAIDASTLLSVERGRVLAALREAVSVLTALQTATPSIESPDSGVTPSIESPDSGVTRNRRPRE